MAKLGIRLDRRHEKAGGVYPLKITIAQKGATVYLPTGIDLAPEHWKAESSVVVKRPDKARLNMKLMNELSRLEGLMEELPRHGMTAKEIRDFLLDPTKESRFLPRYIEVMGRCATEGNRNMYKMCLRNMEQFDSSIGERTWGEINKDWLCRFDAFLAKTQCVNTRSIRLRCIRAVFNDALDNGITTCYPFRAFKIRHEQTRKRALTIDQLRELRDYPCAEWQKEYRDMFMLMVYLGGINAADLFQAKRTDIIDGRLEYRRQKTHKLYSVKIEPEAKTLINRHKGAKLLLSPLERYKDYRDYLSHLNRALKAIGRVEGKRGKVIKPGAFPDLSTYWARHTLATIAASIGIPMDTISQILGHSFGNETTQIYIAPDRSRSDEAMRKVLDAIK